MSEESGVVRGNDFTETDRSKSKVKLQEIRKYNVLEIDFEPFSLKMYIRSAKTYHFCVLVCFAFMHALLSCMLRFHVCTHLCFHLMSNVRKMAQRELPLH